MLSPEEACKFLSGYRITRLGTFRRVNYTPKSLANMRSRNIGPKYKKKSGKIFYDLQDLKLFRKELAIT